MKAIRFISISLYWIFVLTGSSSIFSQESFNPLRSSYMGQKASQDPGIFLPGKISTGADEGCSLFYRGALSFLWRTNRPGDATLLLLEDRKGRWQPPKQVHFFSDDSKVWDFTIAPEGDRIYFTSDQKTTASGSNIWVIRLISDQWQEPEELDSAVNSDLNDSYPSITENSDLFFFRRDRENPSDCDLYMASATPEGFAQAVRLKAPVNGPSLDYDPFIAADGSYLIFSSRRIEGLGEGDLYISFRKADRTWGEPINLGSEINSSKEENRPSVTLDGDYFFFTSNRLNQPKLPPGVPPARSMPGKGSRDIYWMKADFIENLRKNPTDR